eukprot:gene29320-36347_t
MTVLCPHSGVQCNGFRHGCAWSGLNKDLKVHLAVRCQLEFVDCPLKRNLMCSVACTGKVRRTKLNDHLASNITGQNVGLILSELEATKAKLDTLSPVVDGLAILKLDGGENIYCGQVKDGVRHGHGLLLCQDKSGDYYCGSWVDGKEEGFGEEQGQCDNDICLYRGDYHAGQQCGSGTMTWGNGDSYSGQWAENQQHGLGLFTYKNGDSYHGMFVHMATACSYAGLFLGSQYHGQGVLRLANGQVYTGYFEKGKYHGQGRITQHDGLVYEGMFEKDKYNGLGVLYCAGGSVFKGHFVRGLEEGEGEIVSAKGVVTRGVWKKGALVK